MVWSIRIYWTIKIEKFTFRIRKIVPKIPRFLEYSTSEVEEVEEKLKNKFWKGPSWHPCLAGRQAPRTDLSVVGI